MIGGAAIICAIALLLLVVFGFVITWRLVSHKTSDPNEIDAQLRQIEDDIAKELKALKMRILTLEGNSR